MAGVVDTTYSFVDNDLITSAKLNNIIDQTTFTSDALVSGNNTLLVTGGKLMVKAGGITSNELASNAVTTTAITDLNVTAGKLADSAVITVKLNDGAVTTAKITDVAVTTAKIASASITAPKLDGAQTGSAPIYAARAWVKLNPYVSGATNTAYKLGTYSTSGGFTTVSILNHGLKANDKIRLDFASGTAPDGLYTVINSADANTFVVLGAGTTSGNVTAQFVAIQASGNISTATLYDGTPYRIVLNFANPMPSDDYAILATANHFPGAWISAVGEDTVGTTDLNTVHQAYVAFSQTPGFVNVVIFG